MEFDKNLINELSLKEVSEIENEIYNYALKIARNLFKVVLEKIDDDLKIKSFNLISNGKRRISLKTKFGVVNIKRRIYKDTVRNNYRYLLDEYCRDLNYVSKFSKNLVNSIKELILTEPYREVKNNLNKLSNVDISHQSIWNVVQKLGNSLFKKELNILNSFYKTNDIKVKDNALEVNVLKEEVDGVFLNIVGGKMAEMKMSVVYTHKDNSVKNKLIFGGFYDVYDFHTLREIIIKRNFKVNDKTIRVLNTDGAKWCKNNGIQYNYKCLDVYHLNNCIIRNINTKKMCIEFLNYAKAGEVDLLLSRLYEEIEKLEFYDKSKLKKYKAVIKYIKNNREEILNNYLIKNNKNELLKNNTTLGIQESINRLVITRRMKNRGMTWSVKGANNLVKLLTQHYSDIKDI